MAENLEDYINKGHVEVLVEALKYSDASMFDEATNEIKKPIMKICCYLPNG